MKKNRLYWLLLSIMFVSLGYETVAQNNSTRSPYSRYAFGELVNKTSVAMQSMGNVSVGIRNPYIVNSVNPASYTSVDSLTFILDMGISGGYSFLSQNGKKDSYMLGNLDYVSVLFPVTKYLGISAGIHPIVERGYLFGSTQNNDGEIENPSTYQSLFKGAGNINEVYLGIGGKVYKGLSIGVNGNFIYGNESKWRQIVFNAPDAFNPTFRDEISLKGFKLDIGAQYQHTWGKEDKESFFVVGATFSPKSVIKAESKSIDFVSNSSGTTTVGDNSTKEYKTNLPMQSALGVSLGLNKTVVVAADLSFQNWSKVDIGDGVKTKDVFKWALGTEWTPDYRSRNFFSISSYRIGVNGSNSYFSFPLENGGKEESFYNIGASLGIGMPLVDRRSMINISFDYKYIMPSSTSMIKEQYIGLSLGIMFNGNWFRQMKVD